MRGVKRLSLAGVLALVLAAVAATPAGAVRGGNNDNAKLCQQGGWMTVTRSDGTHFTSQDECASYGAEGGTILVPPPTP